MADSDINGSKGKEIPELTRQSGFNGVLLNLRANRWVTLGSNHCKCSLNQHMLDDSMATARRLSLKTR
jgi:hypothetical protein